MKLFILFGIISGIALTYIGFKEKDYAFMSLFASLTIVEIINLFEK